MRHLFSLLAWPFIAFFALLLQIKLTVFGFLPDLSLVVVYAFGIKHAPAESAAGFPDIRPEVKAMIFGTAVGLMEDALGGTLAGPNFLCKGLAGFLASFLFRDIFFGWTPLVGGLSLAAITLLAGFANLAARVFFTPVVIDGIRGIEIVVAGALINIPLGTLIRPASDHSRSPWINRRRYS